MKKTLTTLVLGSFLTLGAFAADLTVEAQFDITGKDLTKSYLTVKGPGASVDKDTVDAATGASKNKGTEVLNTYRRDAANKNLLPGGIQSLLKYGVSVKDFVVDNLTVSKAANGVITVQYVHRGTAYRMITDATGKLAIPAGNQQKRVVAFLKDGVNVVSKEFSPTGDVKDIQWAKVWDNAVPAGTLMATSRAADGKVTEIKTSAVMVDAPDSAAPYLGTFQFTLNGNILLIKADLNLKK